MVLVFLADGFEEIEALTPVDYLKRCEVEVKTVGVRGKMVRGSHGITVVTDWTMYDIDVDQVEMIVLPGGMPGTLNLEKCALLRKLILHCAEHEIPIGAICAAPTILGHLGLLKGRNATCFPGFEPELEGARVTGSQTETDGNYITGRGAGAANEFAFALVEKLLGRARADHLRDSVCFDRGGAVSGKAGV